MSSPLLRLVAQRLALGIGLLFAVSALIFFGTEILPGDVAQAILGRSATPQALENMRMALGLDRPAVVRYFEWLGNFLTGDLGTAVTNGREITDLIGARLSNTLLLAASTAVFAIPLSIFLGIVSVQYKNRWPDKVISILSLGAISLPEFFLGYMLVAVFAVNLGWLPPISTPRANWDFAHWVNGLVLPCTTLLFAVMAHMLRMTRAAVIQVLGSAYIETAELKGLPTLTVILRHAVPNSIAPIVNVVMLNLAYLVVGVVVVEVVFVYPGLGNLMVDNVRYRDVPVVQACGLIFAATYIGLNIVADLASIVANPRLRHPR